MISLHGGQNPADTVELITGNVLPSAIKIGFSQANANANAKVQVATSVNSSQYVELWCGPSNGSVAKFQNIAMTNCYTAW